MRAISNIRAYSLLCMCNFTLQQYTYLRMYVHSSGVGVDLIMVSV